MTGVAEVRCRRLDGRRALVTGAASGIGLATVQRLLAEGAQVVLADARGEALEAAARGLGSPAQAVVCDVGSEPDVERLVAQALARLGGIDIVVSCAGIVRSGPTHELSLDVWDTVMRVNLTGTFLVLKHCIPPLRAAGGGSIVTIGSVASVVAAGRTSAYDASKGGVLQLTRAVAVENADFGIRANCVLPGIVRTSLVATSTEMHGAMDAAPGAAARIRVPQARAAEPAEIGAVVAFLASDDASFITGAAITADGGYTAI